MRVPEVVRPMLALPPRSMRFGLVLTWLVARKTTGPLMISLVAAGPAADRP